MSIVCESDRPAMAGWSVVSASCNDNDVNSIINSSNDDGGGGGDRCHQRPLLQLHFEPAEHLPRPANLASDIVRFADSHHKLGSLTLKGK